MIENRSRPEAKPVAVRGRDFRFKADGSAFEAVSGGGQFGHSFDDWGHRFTCNNSNHIRQIVLPAHYLDRNPALIPPAVLLDIAAEGPAAPVFRISPAEPWRVVRTRQRAADPALSRRLPPTELFATGFFTSATGVTVYRGTSYPPNYRGNVFVGDVGGNLVHRKILTSQGPTFLARRADPKTEFLASTDNWFRPVNFANTPDGALLLIDMYRETIEHPLSIPDPIKKHLDLKSGSDRGRLYNLVYSGSLRRPRPNLSRALSAELVRLLADPDAWWRETAQRLLFERQDRTVIEPLRSMVKDRPTALGRLHALWTLSLLAGLDSGSIVLGLEDPEPRVREQAIKLAEGRLTRTPALVAKLLPLAVDKDPMVRLQLAFSLGEANADPRVIAALASIATADPTTVWTRTAVLSSIAGQSVALLGELGTNKGFLTAGAGEAWLDELAFLVGSERDPVQATRLLGTLSVARSSPQLLMRAAVALARGRKRSGASAQTLLEGMKPVEAAALLAEAARIAGSAGPAQERMVAIKLLVLTDQKTARGLLTGLLDARQPEALQLGVLQALAELLDTDLANQIAVRWRSMSPTVRREAVEVLFSRRDGILAVLGAFESRAIRPAELDLARLKELRNYPDLPVQTRARQILAVHSAAAPGRSEVIALYSKAITLAGDPLEGRRVFVKVCATCHQAEEQGFDVGPNLSTVVNRSAEDLLIHVLDPNREVAPPYVNYNVALVDGRVKSGIIALESANTITLKRAQGATDVVARDQIAAIAATGVSLMPEGLEQDLSHKDVANLIAFIRSIRAPAERATVTGPAK